MSELEKLKTKVESRRKNWQSINNHTDKGTNKYRLEQQRIRELDYVLELIETIKDK